MRFKVISAWGQMHQATLKHWYLST